MLAAACSNRQRSPPPDAAHAACHRGADRAYPGSPSLLCHILTFLAITIVAIAALVERSEFQDIVDTLTEIADIGAQITGKSTVVEATVYMTEMSGKLSIAVDQAKGLPQLTASESAAGNAFTLRDHTGLTQLFLEAHSRRASLTSFKQSFQDSIYCNATKEAGQIGADFAYVMATKTTVVGQLAQFWATIGTRLADAVADTPDCL
ncbi:hypothetical protein C8F04DRAFT_1199308 [Mycena alexandri]|uniref:Uncharacterized protein n=1 Tax=Mycena alexandri TaxID=1745969 RepID=A0AAD6RZG3_9AGAR|nr:hypothetical protein C8F04DRAFT_1199308 [Mycena alexandri]